MLFSNNTESCTGFAPSPEPEYNLFELKAREADFEAGNALDKLAENLSNARDIIDILQAKVEKMKLVREEVRKRRYVDIESDIRYFTKKIETLQILLDVLNGVKDPDKLIGDELCFFKYAKRFLPRQYKYTLENRIIHQNETPQ
jgi:hypothetical protein